jgi:RNA polymerase sigma-70 factor (ECF subfamily)
VVQSAYFRIVDATDKWQPDKPLEEPVGYLYRIIRNLSIDERRRLRRSTPTGQDADVSGIDRVAENQPNPETVAIARNELMILQAALDELPARTRKAFELHRFAGLKLVDIAAHLDISVGTAHTLVAQALDHCRQRLLRGQQT